MSKNERIRDRYPALSAYDGTHEFLDAAAAAETTREGRIASVWPFIVRRVLAFAETLKPRELANYDPEDVVSEIWLKLAEKDDQWTPARGKYITFAGVIIDHELHAIRDKARTVHAPRNSSCRMKQYRDEAAAGTMSERKAKTANDILRTRDGTFGLMPVASNGSDTTGVAAMADDRIERPIDAVANKEALARYEEAIKLSVRRLPAFEAYVVSRLAGLGSKEPESVWYIAWKLKRDESEVRRAKDRAVRKIREHLSEIEHPAATGCL